MVQKSECYIKAQTLTCRKFYRVKQPTQYESTKKGEFEQFSEFKLL